MTATPRLASLATFVAVSAALLVVFYPVYQVGGSGHLSWTAAGFVPLWKADFGETVPFLVVAELLAAAVAALLPWAALRYGSGRRS